MSSDIKEFVDDDGVVEQDDIVKSDELQEVSDGRISEDEDSNFPLEESLIVEDETVLLRFKGLVGVINPE